jgi:GNAT superfamily N-acetyltransferase
MSSITYHRIKPEDTAILEQIAGWYFEEWKMTPATTIQRLSGFPVNGIPFHLLMTVDGIPVATGGLAHEVSLMTEVPRLKMYQPWLALVYTITENQNKGYGTMLCHKIEEMAREQGVKEYFLFTYTAEKLYLKLGWEVMERISARDKDMVIMRKHII